MSLARSARRLAKDAEEATLQENPYVHKAAQVAAISQGWGNQEKNRNTILNLGVLIGTPRAGEDQYRLDSGRTRFALHEVALQRVLLP